MENKSNLIKVFDSKKANELADLGFRYTLESINSQSVYAFFVSEKLLNYINSNFSASEFFFENTLRF